MIQLLTFLFGSFGVKIAWYVVYYGFNTIVITFYVAFIAWVLQVFVKVYDYISTLVNFLSASSGDALTSQIYGLLDCMGVIDGIVSGLPIMLTSVLTVLSYIAGQHLYNFYQSVSKLMIGWKP